METYLQILSGKPNATRVSTPATDKEPFPTWWCRPHRLRERREHGPGTLRVRPQDDNARLEFKDEAPRLSTRRAISRPPPGMTYVKLTAEIVDWTTHGHRVDTHNSARAQWIAGCWLSAPVVLLLPFFVEMRQLLSFYEPRLLPSRLQQRRLLQPMMSQTQEDI